MTPVQTSFFWDRPHGRCSFNFRFCHFHLPGSRKIWISFGNRKVEKYRPELDQVRDTNMPGTNDQMEVGIPKVCFTRKIFRFPEWLNGSGLRILLTWEYNRYRWSIRIHLLENTVDIDGHKDSPTWKYGRYLIDRRFHSKIGRNRPSIWIHVKKKIGRYRPSMYRHTEKNRSMVDIDRHSGHGLKRIVHIDLTHLYFITNRCKQLTRTITSFHGGQFQALLTKQHTRKKQTHNDKMWTGHRVKSISRRSG